MKNHILFFLISFFSFVANAQEYFYSGRVFDAENNEPLAFVNLKDVSSNNGCISDIEGVFLLKSDKKIDSISVSYVGYISDTITIKEKSNINIYLKRNIITLAEVIILPGENPAHRIIDSAICYFQKNDPFSLNSFSYSSYGKFLMTINIDSTTEAKFSKEDSSFLRVKKFLNNQHLFLMESVSERKFLKPDKDNENIVASRVSGMSNPLFTLLISQIQPFSFYKPLISIADKKYVNPISSGSTNKYFFLLKDTLFEGSDTIFIISFEPKKGKNFESLKGLLYIHSNKWAIQSVIAESSENLSDFSFKIKQDYFRPDSINWFPKKLQTFILFKSIAIGGLNPIGHNSVDISDVKINPEIKKSEFEPATLIISPDAKKKDSVYWDAARPEKLTIQEKNTYRIIDSIGKKENFDKFINVTKALLSGFIPWGPVSLEIDKFYSYNVVEGNRFGLGLKTNNRVSRRFSLYGYYGYGLKDKKHKFASRVDVFLNKKLDRKIAFGYKQDVFEDGFVKFGEESASLLSTEGFRNYFTNRIDYYNMIHFDFKSRFGKSWQISSSIYRAVLRSPSDILFGNYNEFGFSGTNLFTLSDVYLQIGYFGGKKYLQEDDYSLLISENQTMPSVSLSIWRSFPKIADCNISLTRAALRISQIVNTRYYGTFSWVLEGNIVSPKVPLSLSIGTPASYEFFSIFSPNSFETMRINEFYSTQSAFLFLRHSFLPLFGKKRFSPVPELVTNIAFGSYKNKEYIKTPEFKTLENGFFESGLFLNDILDMKLYTIGIGAVYRYGYNSFDRVKDNVAIKMSLKFKI
ncbi:MAG: carboxypeptidase-like regulatory domain-containing protein [Bacteroidales bacterium]|nr:carboxypeptidase-like regulatory domain-containing protein [Bacteroidales bacterium]